MIKYDYDIGAYRYNFTNLLYGPARFNKRMLNPLGRIKSLQICQIMTKHISAHPLNSFRAKKESVSFIMG
jgi:hypothetical protein